MRLRVKQVPNQNTASIAISNIMSLIVTFVLLGAAYLMYVLRTDMVRCQQYIPENQTGKVIVITGANSGLGYYTALSLAQAGGTVVLGCRTATKVRVMCLS